MNVGVIVEGHGDVVAVPLLVRRVAAERGMSDHVTVLAPHRVPRSKLVKPGELERAIELLARKVGGGGSILVVLDADDDCPASLGPELVDRARAQRPDRAIEVVLARREYEAWFLAAARSLRGRRGLPEDLVPPDEPEEVRDAKGWLGARMPGGYGETIDQPAFTAAFSLDEAAEAASYRKLERSLRRLLAPGS